MEPRDQDVKKRPEDVTIDDEPKGMDECASLIGEEQQCGCCDDAAGDLAGGERAGEECEGCENRDRDLEEWCGDEARRKDAYVAASDNKWVSFFELPTEIVGLARGSVIPPDILNYYKQFGLTEEEIKLIFQMRPSEEAAHKPAVFPPFKGTPKAGG